MSNDSVQITDQREKAAPLAVRGLHGLAGTDLETALAAGGRFVFYEYCISFIAVTLRRPSSVYYLPAGSWGIARGLPYVFLSLLLGWWGIPWGIVYTPLALATNLTGGCDVTAQVRSLLQQAAPDG